MAREARPRRSANDWHSLTNVSHWWRAAVFDADGLGPAPIEPGSASASRAVSDAVLGPQVPPIAGAGSAVNMPAAP
jgi:hypothetical protein